MISNKKIIENHYNIIKLTCYGVSEGHYLTEDLISEVCYSLLSKENSLLHDVLDRGKFNSYVYGIANTMFWKPKSKFYCKYRINYNELNEYELQDETKPAFDVKDYLLELGLTPTEKLWIETCLEYKFNYSLVSKKTGISRSHISKRIKAITNKYK